MTVSILMPQLGFGIEEAVLAEWLFKDGDSVKAGEPIMQVETEKALQDIEAPTTGTLRISCAPGVKYAVGTELGTIVSV